MKHVTGYVVATDGACAGNPGIAGWGYCTTEGHTAWGGLPRATNQAVELLAIAEGLEHTLATHGPRDTTILTDSQYSIGAAHKWRAAWERKGLRTGTGKAISNLATIQRIWVAHDTIVAAGYTVAYVWVKGHAGHAMNELADTLAGYGVKDAQVEGRATRTVGTVRNPIVCPPVPAYKPPARSSGGKGRGKARQKVKPSKAAQKPTPTPGTQAGQGTTAGGWNSGPRRRAVRGQRGLMS